MPTAEDLVAPIRERRLNPLTDGLGASARAHEHRLLSAARPALPFDGPGHYDLRTRSRELFTERSSGAFVEKAWGSRLETARAALEAGEDVDVADLSRILVGRTVVTFLGMPTPAGDDGYREIFETGERLASIALVTTAGSSTGSSPIGRSPRARCARRCASPHRPRSSDGRCSPTSSSCRASTGGAC